MFSVLIGISTLLASLILSTQKHEGKYGEKIARRIGLLACVMIALTLSYWLLVVRGEHLNAFLLLLSLGSFLVGLLIVFVNVPLNTTLMCVVDKGMLSKVSSLISILSQGLIPIASVLGGLVLQVFGSAWLLGICSLGLAATSLAQLFNRHIKDI